MTFHPACRYVAFTEAADDQGHAAGKGVAHLHFLVARPPMSHGATETDFCPHAMLQEQMRTALARDAAVNAKAEMAEMMSMVDTKLAALARKEKLFNKQELEIREAAEMLEKNMMSKMSKGAVEALRMELLLEKNEVEEQLELWRETAESAIAAEVLTITPPSLAMSR